MLAGKNDVVDVIVYPWPIHDKLCTLLCVDCSLMTLMQLTQDLTMHFGWNKQPAAIHNKIIVNGQLIPNVLKLSTLD